MTINEFIGRLDTLPNSQLITENHLGAWLRVSISKIQKDRVKGSGIPFKKPGGVVRYRVGDVREYLSQVSFDSTSGYQAAFAYELDMNDLTEGRAVPFVVVDGIVRDFFETLDADVDEIVWLSPKEQRLNFAQV